jgi:hypothetical protein
MAQRISAAASPQSPRTLFKNPERREIETQTVNETSAPDSEKSGPRSDQERLIKTINGMQHDSRIQEDDQRESKGKEGSCTTGAAPRRKAIGSRKPAVPVPHGLPEGAAARR